jgi:phosphoribosylformylglycinamidine synthase
MVIGGRLGAQVTLDDIPGELDDPHHPAGIAARLFSESNSRFVCEVPPAHTADFRRALAGVPAAEIGAVTEAPNLRIECGGAVRIQSTWERLRRWWSEPLDWNGH